MKPKYHYITQKSTENTKKILRKSGNEKIIPTMFTFNFAILRMKTTSLLCLNKIAEIHTDIAT